MKNGIHHQIRITVIGARQVGKSALTVRYLTRRYIGEYKSHTDLTYRQVFCLDGSGVEVEIVDVSNQPEDASVPTARAKNSDACVLVYSIADRASFRAAQEALIVLQASNRQRFSEAHRLIKDPDVIPIDDAETVPVFPVVMLGNKKDLSHLRQVETIEGQELARQFGCTFAEVSAAEANESEPEDLAEIFNQLIREARLFKIRLQDANNNASNNHGNGANQPTANSANPNNNRQRKRSVFIINRMFGSLMGRNSMPPDLPSTRKGGVAQMASSMPNVAGSFRSVFKKRSV